MIDNLSLAVDKAEFIGLIGQNGAGKTTLLRLLAGVYTPDEGQIKLDGRQLAVVGSDLGLKGRLTMRDNIFLLGAFWGLSPQLIRKNFDSIVKYSELEDFLYTKLFKFSRGMLERLIFSVLIHAQAEIILLDEFFEAVDEKFRQRAEARLADLVLQGTIIILASHDLSIIRRLANRTIFINQGKIIDFDDTQKVLSSYRLL